MRVAVPSETVYLALHTVSVLEQPSEPAAPLDVHPQFPESISQHGLDLWLWGEQDEGEFGRGKVQVMKTPVDTPSIDMDPQLCLGETPLQQASETPRPRSISIVRGCTASAGAHDLGSVRCSMIRTLGAQEP